MAGAAGWPCDGPSPTQGKPGGVPVVPYPPRLLLIDAIPWVWENDKKAGVGTVVALMLPYVIWIAVLWALLFAAWYLLGLPWGCEHAAA